MTEAFEITGAGTLLVACLLALGALVGVTRLWPRLATPGAKSVVGRVVAQLLVTVVLVAAVGVAVNRGGLWFVSWRDLGSVLLGPGDAAMTEHGAAPGSAAATDVGPWGPANANVAPSAAPTTDPHTGLTTYTVSGPASGHTGKVHVWTPPAGTAAPRRVLEVFHGYPVSAQSAFANLRLGDWAAQGLRDTVIVIPDWSPVEFDTECVDGPAGKMETWLTTDVPAWAVRTLGAAPDRGSWATLGYSAGGYCASMAAMRHPQTYAAGISLGGYTRPVFSAHYTPFPPEGTPYDLPRLARTDPPPVALLTQYSHRDTYAAPSSADLVAAARAPFSVTAWETPDTGHRVGAWKPLIPHAFAWLKKTAPGFA
ncbi:alpha/beta hydrolase [Mobilicoccus massiliensis]|uniref:alpha/beta hydrolase n=1 Tax=Mobilicoccus massiliensis TaxID=1522310 RepID=UPI00058BA584|nr:alpha/beta hydrolase-fold protein [Mobilicoccus massiliensis]